MGKKHRTSKAHLTGRRGKKHTRKGRPDAVNRREKEGREKMRGNAEKRKGNGATTERLQKGGTREGSATGAVQATRRAKTRERLKPEKPPRARAGNYLAGQATASNERREKRQGGVTGSGKQNLKQESGGEGSGRDETDAA